MGFEDRKEHASEPSRKGKLSFVLNEDDAMAQGQQHDSMSSGHLGRQNYDRSSSRDRNNELRGRVNPSGFDSAKGHNRSTPLSFSQQPRTAMGAGYMPTSERSAMHRLHSSGEAPGSEKRGVRKKRQRKFVCDTCGFGFYTNSDLQKVASPLSKIRTNFATGKENDTALTNTYSASFPTFDSMSALCISSSDHMNAACATRSLESVRMPPSSAYIPSYEVIRREHVAATFSSILTLVYYSPVPAG